MDAFTDRQLVINIADLIGDAKVDFGLSSGGNPITLDWIVIATNLAVNTMATLLIVYRAWYISISITYFQVIGTYSKSRTHHKSIRAVSRNRKTQVEAILLLFIESGALFAAIQVGEFLACFQKIVTASVLKLKRSCTLSSRHWE